MSQDAHNHTDGHVIGKKTAQHFEAGRILCDFLYSQDEIRTPLIRLQDGTGGTITMQTGSGVAASGSTAGTAGGLMSLVSGAGGASAIASVNGGAGAEIDATAGNGGAATATTGTATAGAGGAIDLNAGTGGANSSTGAAAGGAGGDVTVSTGTGGNVAGTSVAGSGGDVIVTSGAGGNSTSTGNGGAGGDISLLPGTGGTSTGGDPGDVGNVVLGRGSGPGVVRVANSTTFSRSPGRWYFEEFFHKLPGVQSDFDFTTTGPTDAEFALFMAKNFHWMLVGDNSVSANATYSATLAGVTITTDTNAGDEIIIRPRDEIDGSAVLHSLAAVNGLNFRTNAEIDFEAAITLGGTLTGSNYGLGMKLTADFENISGDAHGVWFRGAGGGANWSAITNVAGVDTDTDTGVAAAPSTTYRVRISVDSNLIPRFYIDETLVETGPAVTTGQDLIPVVGMHTTAGGARAMTVHYIKISRVITSAA